MKYIINEYSIVIGVDYDADGYDYNIVDPNDVVYGRDMIVNGQFFKGDNRVSK